MLFNSYVFILAFLPLTLLGYYLLGRLPERIPLNKLFLVLASFVFYGYNNPSYVPIIVCSILVNYALSQMMLSCERKAVRLPLMLLGLFLNLGVLFYFKYHDFFVTNLNLAFGTQFSLYHLALPLGISFFTFQQLSYVIDSYRRTVPRYRILDYALFVTFFPQLVAGPIVLHSEIVPQFADVKNRRFNFDNFAPGLYAFALGLFKKVIIADTFGVAVTEGFANALSLNTAEAWFVAIGYTLQLLRLLRLLRRGHRRGPDVQHQNPAQLQLALQVPQYPRVLAALAHHALPLPDDLHLLPAGRQPQGHGAHLRQPDDRLPGQRPVAWRGLAVPALGPDARRGERALPPVPQAV